MFLFLENNPEFTLKIENLAKLAVNKISVSFVAIDIAQKENGDWLVIEVGDGQFSDIRGISPIKFWNIIKSSIKNGNTEIDSY